LTEPLFKRLGTFFKKLTHKSNKTADSPSGQSPQTAIPGRSERQRAPAAQSATEQRKRSRAPRRQREGKGEAAGAGERRRRAGAKEEAAARRGQRSRSGVPPRQVSTPGEVSAPRAWDLAEFHVPPEEGKVRFHDLELPPELLHAVFDLGFQYCTPIQAGILAHTLAGADATGRAQTGTGKTAAFLITILSHFLRHPAQTPRKKGAPRSLILAPTRELVLQIEKDARSLSKYTRVRTVAVFGGMDYRKQQEALSGAVVDIVAATPGRLLDFKRTKRIDLSQVEILIIDEADRLLDMGFIPDVRRIIESTPMKGKRQTMFFSATLTPEVNRLAAAWTRDAVQVDVTPPRDITLSTIDQVVYITTDDEKLSLLFNLITVRNLQRVMVFANRRDEAQHLKNLLTSRGIHCGLLSGDVSQQQRVKTLEAFRDGRFRVLVATDVAARGLHIEGVTHVVNYSLPLDPEDYVHRIGRTGRAGATGTSVSFATETEAYEIPKIEEFIGRALPAVHPDQEFLTPLPPPVEGEVEPVRSESRGARGKGPRTQGRSRRGGSSGGSRGGPRRRS
jgi:ATP-dependent RNA helicase RhlB